MTCHVLRAAFVVLVCAPAASAQIWIGRDTPRAGSVEMSGGAVATGGRDLPDIVATLTRNPTTGSDPLELFRSDSTLGTAIGGQLRAGVYLSSRISVEGGLQYVRPQIRARLTSDFEEADDTTATTTVTSYLFTGSALFHFGGQQRLRPFVLVGGGHVRDVYAGNELIETGNEFHGGGGIKTWLGTGRRKLGFRLDVIGSVRDGGVGTEGGRRIVPTAAASLAYLF